MTYEEELRGLVDFAEQNNIIINNINSTENEWHGAPLKNKSKYIKSASYIHSTTTDGAHIATLKNHKTGEKYTILLNKKDKWEGKYTKTVIEKEVAKIDKTISEKREAWFNQLATSYNVEKNIKVHPYVTSKNMNDIFSDSNYRSILSTLPYDIQHEKSLFIYAHRYNENNYNLLFEDKPPPPLCFQVIYMNKNEKNARYFGAKSYTFSTLGNVKEASMVFIGEGISTVWSAQHLDSKYAGIICGDADNMRKVCNYLLPFLITKYKKICLLTDNDCKKDSKNTGLETTRSITFDLHKKIIDKSITYAGLPFFVFIPESKDAYTPADAWDMWHERGDTFMQGMYLAILNFMKINGGTYGFLGDVLIKYNISKDISAAIDLIEEPVIETEEKENSSLFNKLFVPFLPVECITGGDVKSIRSETTYLIAYRQEIEHVSYKTLIISATDFYDSNKTLKVLIGAKWDHSEMTGNLGRKTISNIYSKITKHVTYYEPHYPGWIRDIQSFGLMNTTVGKYKIVSSDSSGNSVPEKYIKSKGTLEDWKNTIGKQLQSVLIAEIAFLVVGTAPLRFFSEQPINPLILFVANPEFGKTLLCRAIVSMIGDGDNLMVANVASENSYEPFWQDLNGLVVFMDEITALPSPALESIAYNYPNGFGKTRATQTSGESQRRLQWRSCGIATAEKTMAELRLEKQLTEMKKGEESRVITLDFRHLKESEKGILFSEYYGPNNIPKLFSKAASDTLDGSIMLNHGTVIKHYVEYLSNIYKQSENELQLRSRIKKLTQEFLTVAIVEYPHLEPRALKIIGEQYAGGIFMMESGIWEVTKDHVMKVALAYLRLRISDHGNQESNAINYTEILANFINTAVGRLSQSTESNIYQKSNWHYEVSNGLYQKGHLPLFFKSRNTNLRMIGFIRQGSKTKAEEGIKGIIFLKYADLADILAVPKITQSILDHFINNNVVIEYTKLINGNALVLECKEYSTDLSISNRLRGIKFNYRELIKYDQE